MDASSRENAVVSAVEPDWDRERPRSLWDPSRRLILSIRCYQAWRKRGVLGRIVSRWYVLQHRCWSVITGAEISLNSSIGGGLILPHPNGLVIHPRSTIGPNCLIFQQVTIGCGGSIPGVPKVGGHVDIGAGAKLLGGISIGPHAKIGANAVVLADVPAGATAVGVPARVVASRRTKVGSSETFDNRSVNALDD